MLLRITSYLCIQTVCTERLLLNGGVAAWWHAASGEAAVPKFDCLCYFCKSSVPEKKQHEL